MSEDEKVDSEVAETKEERRKRLKREACKRYYEANSGKVKEKGKRWREANPEKVKECRKLYYEANREKEREYVRLRIEARSKNLIFCTICNQQEKQGTSNHSGRRCEQLIRNSKQRAKKKHLPHDLTYDWLRIRWVKQKQLCGLCDIPMYRSNKSSGVRSATIDRIIPERGYVQSNCWLVCHRCNVMKSDIPFDRLPLEWQNRINNRPRGFCDACGNRNVFDDFLCDQCYSAYEGDKHMPPDGCPTGEELAKKFGFKPFSRAAFDANVREVSNVWYRRGRL